MHDGMDKHEKTYLRGRGIKGKPKWEKVIWDNYDGNGL